MKRCVFGSASRRTDGLSLPTAVLALLLALHTGAAAAHALVIASQPVANSEVAPGTVAIDLKFNSRLDRKRARLRLIDASGAARDLSVTDDDSPDHLRTTTASLDPGNYRVEWYVLSPDGHVTRGNVPFKVQAPAKGVPATP